MEKTKWFLALFLCQSLLLIGCSSEQGKWQKQLDQQVLTTQTKLERLKKHIESGHIANVGVLKQYASIVKKSRPDVGPLANALAQDATPNGPIIKSLESRLSNAQSDIPNAISIGYEPVNKVFQELSAIEAAANPDTYGMILSDPINVLADMSDGKLARVAAMSRDASARINNADNFGAGSQLVGNPHYGNWESSRSGGSFWQWYGQYAFFSSLFHRPIYYSNWGRSRDYSYYHDYGRSTYTSPAQRRGQDSVERRTKDRFNRSGKRFNSPYAKTKHTTAQVARTQSKFRSSAKTRSVPKPKKSTTSNYRSSSYQSSRSSFGGK